MTVSLRAALPLLFFPISLLAGCGNQSINNPIQSGPVRASGFTGTAYGGQSPIKGAAIYLMAAGATGYGAASTSLLTSGSPGVSVDTAGHGYVTTDDDGNFSITSDYTCPTADTPVYLLSMGGNPGLSGTQTNSAIAEMDALGPCGALTPSTHIIINEVTTVAALTALAPFANADATAFSTSPTNVLGLTNAFVTASNLVSPFIGQANQKTPSGLGRIPYQEINTLADILAACVNSTGLSDTPCNTLFTATTVGGTAPTNTMQAMLNIALHPTQNVSTLFKMVTGTPPFQPTLPAVYNSFTGNYDGTPTDWSLAIAYTGTAFRDPAYLAIDSKGNIWAADYNTYQAVQLSNAGALNYVVPGGVNHQLNIQNYDHALAVDLNDNLWVDNNSYGISKITSAGVLLNPDAYWGFIPGPGTNSSTVAYHSYPADYYKSGFGGISVGTDNSVWLGSADYSHSGLAHTDSSAIGLSFTDLGASGLRNPTTVAIDNSGNFWLNSHNQAPNGVVVKVGPTGTVLSGATGFPANGDPISIAIDHANNAWIAGSNYSTLTALNNSGTPLPGSPFTGGGLAFPVDVAVDGDGHIWVANFNRGGAGVSEFDASGNALSNSKGFYPGTQSASNGAVAIDASGNIWLADWQGGIEELVGLGAPTVTPLALATKNNQLGVRP